MDNELLFILIILFTVVMNIIKAVRKNKGKTSAPAGAAPKETGKQRGEWEKILRELMGEEEKKPQPADRYDYDEEEEVPALAGTAYTTVEQLKGSITGYDEGQRMQSPDYLSRVFRVESALEKETGSEITDSQLHAIDYNADIRAFDLRTAVIYSTILTRPRI
jgi:hypothetical protein